MRIVLVDALRRHRVKTLALRRQVGQPRAALESGEEPKRKHQPEVHKRELNGDRRGSGGLRVVVVRHFVVAEEEQELAAMFGIRSIPNCKLFRDGQPVDEFMGALPEQAVREFLDRHVARESDLQVTEARQQLAAGNAAGAIVLLDEAREADPENPRIALALAEAQVAAGDVDAAEAAGRMIDRGFAAGFPLGRYYRQLGRWLLVAVTEKRTKAEIGALSRVAGWVRVFGMVNSAPGYSEQHLALNGFSDLVIDIFGPEVGRHARSAIGVAGLPLNFAMEIEGEVLIE